jgi:hypothetical protein
MLGVFGVPELASFFVPRCLHAAEQVDDVSGRGVDRSFRAIVLEVDTSIKGRRDTAVVAMWRVLRSAPRGS